MVLLLNNVKHFPCIIHNLQMFVYETICNILKSIICNALKNSHVSISKLYFLKKTQPGYSRQGQKPHPVVLRSIMITDLNFTVMLFFCICLVIYSIWYVYIFHCFNLLILSIFYSRSLKKIP